jgi:hypothetical protein
MHELKIMWEYKTEEFKVERNSDKTCDDILNEFGREGWEAFSIKKEPYFDPRLRIGKYKLQTANIYEVKLKRLVE